MNYYIVLGIPENAGPDAVRRAFRALARRDHPDVGAGSSAGEFRRVLEAYETLNDPRRRQAYDQRLRASRVRRVPAEPLYPRATPEPLWTPRAARPFPHTRPSTIWSTSAGSLLEE